MGIKIVICFIIICLIPPASAVDAFLTAKSSGFMGLNDSISTINVAPTDLVLFMIASYITIAGIILIGALIAYSVAVVLR